MRASSSTCDASFSSVSCSLSRASFGIVMSAAHSYGHAHICIFFFEALYRSLYQLICTLGPEASQRLELFVTHLIVRYKEIFNLFEHLRIDLIDMFDHAI